MTFPEAIRLIIWDLDETFWRGTLEEGEVNITEENASLIKTLAYRGIISSICSKNNLETTRRRLEQDGLWEWFVFPAIEYTFKSNLVRNIVEQMGLRPQTVLFIDDNSFNRAEVREQVPGINVGDETLIPLLLDHPQLQGKPDPELARLERYRVLQTKQQAIAAAEAPGEFLRECRIRISYHFDIEQNFDRIHDMVNRTNQLNFTKQRWNEDAKIARGEYFADPDREYNSHAAYIKVRDRYGYYGICGFMESQGRPPRLKHFLFSCRILNMGVEQFVFQQSKFPLITIVEQVVSKLQRAQTVDWITVVDDAEVEDEAEVQSSIRICLHGPCELAQSTHYLRPFYATLEEFQYPKEGWGIQRPLLRNLILADELRARDISALAQLGLPPDFPGLDMDALGSAAFEGGADFLIWSFSLEAEISLYRHEATGLLIPLSIGGFDSQDMTTVPYETVRAKRPVKRPHFEALGTLFSYVGRGDEPQFRADLRKLRVKLAVAATTLIVIEPFDDLEKIKRTKYQNNAQTNRIVREELAGCEAVHFIRFADCVSGRDEEAAINHFNRAPYMRLATEIRNTIRMVSEEAVPQPA